MELEEGRELGGSIVIYFHALLLYHWSFTDEEDLKNAKKTNKNSGSSTAFVGISVFVGVFAIWFGFQNQMVQAYSSTVDWCQGAFPDFISSK